MKPRHSPVELIVGDFFTYVGAFAIYQCMSRPMEDPSYLGKIVFDAARRCCDGRILKLRTRLNAEQSIHIIGL